MTFVRLAVLTSLLCAALAMPALSATAAAPAPAPATASAEAKASACPGSITLGNRRFAFYKNRVTCTGARTAIRRLYASYGRRGTPRGFRCRSKSRFRKTGGCVSRTNRARYFGYNRP